MKYKVGDVVRISKKLTVRYAGITATIISTGNNSYRLKDIPWAWTDEMLEDICLKSQLIAIGKEVSIINQKIHALIGSLDDE